MILLYAVVPADATIPDLDGVAGRRLEVFRDPTAALVVEDCLEPPEVSAQTALAFAAVLNQIAAGTPLLPVRFPTSMPSPEAVRDELAVRGDGWRRRLRELTGLAEISLRPRWSEPMPGDGQDLTASGAAYLRQRASQARQLDERLSEMKAAVAPWSKETRTLRATDGLRIAALINPRDLSSVRRALAGWESDEPGRRVEVAGPWPPFTFVDATEHDR